MFLDEMCGVWVLFFYLVGGGGGGWVVYFFPLSLFS